MVALFKQSPKRVPVAYGRLMHKLVVGLPSLSAPLRDRLVAEFALHLSNFGFKWPWPAWKAVGG